MVVDNGSTDSSGSVCDTYANEYSNISVYHIENHGVGSARNFGLSKARGEFIYFVDSDDYLVGNLFADFADKLVLDLDLLADIREAIHCQISLHGGSGTPLHYFEDAAKIGVSKININSDMRYAFRTTLEKTLRENPNEYAIVKLMPPVYVAVQEVVESKIRAFNSVRKAVV